MMPIPRGSTAPEIAASASIFPARVCVIPANAGIQRPATRPPVASP